MPETIESLPKAQTEKFIAEMIKETGCSVKFMNQAKPLILKLFKETSGSAQEQCLASFRQTIQNQANSELSTRASALTRPVSGEFATGELLATSA